MSIIYQTTLSPSKYELLAAWLPAQPWFTGDAAQLVPIGAYRFDDPEGEVGCEGHLFTAGDDTVYHVPLTYRGAPLEGAERFVVGTMEHGTLGTRWATDAIGDPVFRAALADAIARGGTGSREFLLSAGGSEVERQPSVRVAGTGSLSHAVPELWAAQVEQRGDTAVAHTELAALEIYRIIAPGPAASEDVDDSLTLRGAWNEESGEHRLGALLAALKV